MLNNYNMLRNPKRSRLSPQPCKSYVEPWEFDYELTTASTSDPVTLDEAKLFARIDDDTDDALVTALISAATKEVESQTGRALMPQTWTAWLDNMPASNVLHLCKGRIASVSSITAYDDDGSEVLDTGSYLVDTDNARIGLIDSSTWPSGTRTFKTFAAEYVAGYADADAVPEWAKTVIKMLVASWYENRETTTQDSQNSVPMGAKMIMQTNKVSRL